MTGDEQSTTVPSTEVPRPRTPSGEFPWPEPWRHSRGARPRSEHWDAGTATWRSRGPQPRSGD